MTENVQADAQFTLTGDPAQTGRILRPFEGFEEVYQGRDGTIPIAFPGTLDEDAGTKGFSPYLLKGTPCPLGARTVVYIPAITDIVEGPPVPVDYAYQLIWRMRNLGDQTRDFEKRRAVPRGYHLSKESAGAEDTLLAPANPERFLIPGIVETVIYQQPEPGPGAVGGTTIGNLRTNAIALPDDLQALVSVTNGLPLLPPNKAPDFAGEYPPGSGNFKPLGIYQQGVADPAVLDRAPLPLFRPYFTTAKGDELLIICARRPFPVEPFVVAWDFDFFDAVFSNVFGVNAKGPQHPPFENLGIYVLFGTNP